MLPLDAPEDLRATEVCAPLTWPALEVLETSCESSSSQMSTSKDLHQPSAMLFSLFDALPDRSAAFTAKGSSFAHLLLSARQRYLEKKST